MSTRQAAKWITQLITLLAFITGCSPSEQPVPSPTPLSPTSTPQINYTPTVSTNTPAPTQLTCLTQPGRVESNELESTRPHQEYFIYLPPCYDEQTGNHYPVLYLLHGQTYTADQWIRLGAVDALDKLILSGESQPFIIVFPDDRYWNVESGYGFGDRLVNHLIPYVDLNYRTSSDRNQRAIGGMSRGAGWALKLGLTRWDLFSIIGLHSLAVLKNDGDLIDFRLKKIPPASRPIVFMDIGDKDQEVEEARLVETKLNKYAILHEWHFYSGTHTEDYWRAHLQEYIEWYASQWSNP